MEVSTSGRHASLGKHVSASERHARLGKIVEVARLDEHMTIGVILAISASRCHAKLDHVLTTGKVR